MNTEQFQHKIAQNKAVNPPDFVWDNIAQHLDKKRRRNVVWIWILTSGILFGVAGYLYFADKQTIIAKVEDKSPSSKIITTDENTLANNGFIQQVEKYEKKHVLSTTDGHKSKANIATTTKSFSKSNTQNIVEYSVQTSQKAVEILSENRVEDQAAVSKAIMEKVSIPTLLGNKLGTCNSLKKNDIEYKDDIICHDFRIKKRKNYFVEAGLQLGRPLKTISGSESEKPLLDLRNHTERAWYSWGAYGKIGMYLYKGIYASTGIEFVQSKELFILEKEAITKMIINFDPNTGLPIDTSFVTGNLVNKGEIRYNATDLPLSVGFLSNVQKWNFGAEVSARINLKFSATGKTYNQNLALTRIENEANMYKSNIGLSLKGSVMIGYNIFRKTTVILKPYYLWQTKPVNDASNPVVTKLNNVGVELGVRRDF